MKILNLYAGIGGNRKLWEDVEVTAVEIDPKIAKIYQDFFPQDKMVIGDAHQYLLEHFEEYDFIWSSPPCPSHSVCSHFLKGQGVYRYPDMKLYEEIIFLKHVFKGKYCVENVDMIALVKGSSPILYGPNSMGGVINIITGESIVNNGFDFKFATSTNAERIYNFRHYGKKKTPPKSQEQ